MKGFRDALPLVLAYEGGYVNDPADPGGATNKGITQRVYDAYRTAHRVPTQSVARITDPEVEEIYLEQYWKPGHCDILPWPLSMAHFDACVNTGIGQATRLLQRAAGVTDDGVWGPATAATAPHAQIARLLLERMKFYDQLVAQRPTLGKFFLGWIKRVLKLSDVR